MKRNNIKLIALLPGLLLPLTGQAESINVDFVATVTSTTCNIKLQSLNGSTVTDNGNNKYTLTIPDVSLDKIVNGAAESQADFELVASDCSNGLSSIVTKITGATTSGNYIASTLTGASDAKNVGMAFKRYGDSDSSFIKPDGASPLTWSSSEIKDGLEMTVALRETTSGAGTTGAFESTATFSFTYQ